MDVFRQVMSIFMNDKCFDTFFLNYNFFDVDCIKSAISKLLGYSIVAGAVLVKVPQIQKIVSSKSAAGVSFMSIMLELYAITCMFSYSLANGFPFSTWGDSFFLLIQVTIIALLVLNYSGQKTLAGIFFISFCAILVVLLSGVTPMSVLAMLQLSNMPAVVTAKLLQAFKCFQLGHTGQISAITVFLTFFGSAARIFTSIQETGDNIMIISYVMSTAANAVVAFQILWYWRATENYIKSTKKKTQ